MPSNVFIRVLDAAGKEIAVLAEDVMHTEAAKVTPTIAAPAPGVLASLVLLATAAARAATDVATDAANPAAVLLGGIQQLQDFVVLWPDIKEFFAAIEAAAKAKTVTTTDTATVGTSVVTTTEVKH